MNIIENSRKGAATDSAYGYKDAVNKAYVQELAKTNNGSLKLDGTYLVQSDGTLNADTGSNFGVTNYTNLPVSVSGDKPTSGKLRYSNNVLNAGCLAIGDYKVIFVSGSVDKAVKGDCDDYVIPIPLPTMAEMCPGCVYGLPDMENDAGISIGSTLPNGFTDNYLSLNRNFFLGVIVEDSVITRNFVCAKNKDGDVFCLEGGAEDTIITTKNLNIRNAFINGCKNVDEYCDDGFVEASADGYIYVGGTSNYNDFEHGVNCYMENDTSYCDS